MNNIKRSDMLFQAANECMEHAKSSSDRKVWNMAIRRAQEAVELDLRGMLARIAVDYPKDHDQAPILLRILNKQGYDTNVYAKEIERISADLSRKRGPALHQEEGYDRETAEEAIKDAQFVIDTMNKIREELSPTN